MTTAWLSQESFTAAVAAVPLISVDLCLTDAAGNLLLGWRNNTPAKNYWFTPGGRIRKNEAVASALSRVAQEELGLSPEILSRARLLGAWDHFYPDSAFSPDVSTHYVNLPYWLSLSAVEIEALHPPYGQDEQHEHWRWMPLSQAIEDPGVHRYVQIYAKCLLGQMSA